MTTTEFNKVIIPLKDSIFRYALSILGNEMDAEDMLQDTYSKLWSMRESLDKFENLDAYVLRMVRNMCIDKLRRERLHEDKLEDAFV
ncbi:MAG: RNA polymerase subunit sigma-70, partial [Bacteroidales bacterium]|nr:RNA polymerase subunit sigma-70 [Bacteroidales bacterium]